MSNELSDVMWFATYNDRIAVCRVRLDGLYSYAAESVSLALGCFNRFELALIRHPKIAYAIGKELGLSYQ